jgi:hypothetical protein
MAIEVEKERGQYWQRATQVGRNQSQDLTSWMTLVGWLRVFTTGSFMVVQPGPSQ